MADSVVVVTADGTVKYANAAAEAFFERPRAELVGSAFAFPMTDSDIRPAQGRVGEMRVTTMDWDGQPAHLAVIRDVSPRERLRALERKLLLANKRSAIAQLAASVAHEINNPTAFILANLAVMRDIIADFEGVFSEARMSRKLMDKYQVTQSLTDMRDMLADNSLGLDRIRSFIRELRALAHERLDDVEMLDVNAVVTLACDLVASVHGSDTAMARELGELPAIAADGFRLTQILVNLLENAIAATRQASCQDQPGTIEVSTRCDGDCLYVVVRDSGCGIPEDNLDMIFEPLFIAGPSRRGIGLGLPIAAEIASSHGGRVEVHSTPGQGSTFRLVLPRDTGLPLSADLQRAAPGHVRARVLLVTQNSELRRRVHAMLDAFHDVNDAESGQDALGRTGLGNYDAVLCDLVSCAGDTMALYKSLLETEPDRATRMVLLGGAQAPPKIKRFIESCRAIALQGPLSGTILREVIERMSR